MEDTFTIPQTNYEMRYVRKPFNRDMVLALLKGKTQTRRKGKLDAHPGDIIAVTEAWWSYGQWVEHGCIPEKPRTYEWQKNPCVKPLYAADYPENWKPEPVENEPGKWRRMPGMHLPLKDTRLFLEVERSWRHKLQDMSPADAIAEGIAPLFSREDIHVPRYRAELDIKPMPYKNYLWPTDGGFSSYSNPVESYASLWDSINGKGDFKWEFNPEVSCYQFKLLQDYKI